MDLGGRDPGVVAFRARRGHYYMVQRYLNRVVSITWPSNCFRGNYGGNYGGLAFS